MGQKFCYNETFILEWSENEQLMTDQDENQSKLQELRLEHRDLDDAISRITENPPFDQIKLQRLKKRKLALKDQISQLEDSILPDIIA